mgnify:CR=1 FL=1
MKRIFAFCLVVVISVSISLGAELYTEPFLSASRAHLDNITTVNSMSAILPTVGEDIPGFGLLNSNARSGEIRYQVQGAEKVTIGFYSHDSAYACWNGTVWTNGVFSIRDHVEKTQPVYMDSTGALYMQDDAIWYQLQTSLDYNSTTFRPVEKAPDFVKPLNLEVYALDSKGGKHSLTGTSNEIRLMAPNSTRHYYEERTYEVPKGTQELIIALNFPWELRDTSGNPMARPPWGLTNYPVVVNEIRIEGTDLIFDQAPVDPDEPSSPGDGDGSGSGSGGGGGGGDDSDDEIILPGNEDEDTWMDRTEMPVSSEESSLILSSSESESSGGKTSSGGNKSGSGKDGEADKEADRSSSEPESETLIYQSDRETIRDKLFSAMLAGYGVIGLGVAWQIYLHTIRKK